jgi:hypothetical protein
MTQLYFPSSNANLLHRRHQCAQNQANTITLYAAIAALLLTAAGLTAWLRDHQG